jgi:hypothetical protein
MSRIKSEELLDRIEKGQFRTIRISGFQGGEFHLMLVDEDGVFIHENEDGSTKHYRKVENILDWLKRKTKLNKVEIGITLWKENEITSRM